jgi:hypothetical protein
MVLDFTFFISITSLKKWYNRSGGAPAAHHPKFYWKRNMSSEFGMTQQKFQPQ